jgi:flagellum-specific peptidoglycan hydrolase FlgJ
MLDFELKFFKEVIPPSIESWKSSDILPCVTIAQAILESGWGRSSLYKLANNPFGIKFSQHAQMEGYKEYIVPTHEGTVGIDDHIETADFVSYPDLNSAFKDHADLLSGPIYTIAYAQRNDWLKFLIALGPKMSKHDNLHCGYSTNIRYALLLKQLIDQFQLADNLQLDKYIGVASDIQTGADASTA